MACLEDEVQSVATLATTSLLGASVPAQMHEVDHVQSSPSSKGSATTPKKNLFGSKPLRAGMETPYISTNTLSNAPLPRTVVSGRFAGRRRSLDKRCSSGLMHDDIWFFRKCLRWLSLDQSTTLSSAFSWTSFSPLGVFIPLLKLHFWPECKNFNEGQSQPFHHLVKFFDCTMCAISFLFLFSTLRHHGLRQVLFLDNLQDECAEVQEKYELKLRGTLGLLGRVLLPCLAAEVCHQVWWTCSVGAQLMLPFAMHTRLQEAVVCTLTVLAWSYQAGVYLFVCVLFRLMCSLQILRLRRYLALLEEVSDTPRVLAEHMRLQDHMAALSHRFRNFLIASLLTVIFAQCSALYAGMFVNGPVTVLRTGDLLACFMVQVTGAAVCLHGAAQITHRAQKVVSVVSQWHAVATINTYAGPSYFFSSPSGASPLGLSLAGLPVSVVSADTPVRMESVRDPSPLSLASGAGPGAAAEVDVESGPAAGQVLAGMESEVATVVDVGAIEHDPSNYERHAYEKRQALVTYLQHAHTGISLYGFVLDQGFLYATFAFIVSMAIFIVSKAIGVHYVTHLS
eukprot:jgi/Mesen1/6111/ME000310S05202